MEKTEIIKTLLEIALLLELRGDNPFKIRAYHNAARTLDSVDDLKPLVENEALTSLEGIGKDLAQKITLLYTKGKLPEFNTLKKSVPKGLIEMVKIPGMGAKKVKEINKKLNIETLAELQEACEKGIIAKLKGFGETTEKNILTGIKHLKEYTKRHLYWKAELIAQPLLDLFHKTKQVQKVEIAGSMRRKRETIGDLDFLVASDHPEKIMDLFTSHEDVEKVTAKGTTKSSVRLKDGMQADLRVLPKEQYPFALVYFTGSKEHNIKLRKRANEKGWSLNEYALSTTKAKKKPPKILTENDLYEFLGLPYIPPELREDRGEFEAAEKGKLPTLIEEKDIRGAFHNHTTQSDGNNTLLEMVRAAEDLGWDYLGIADHSKSSTQANGLDEERLLKQVEKIKQLNRSKKFKTYVFSGTECDILKDGSLDYSDDILKQLDYVVVSIHRGFKQDEKTTTGRLIRAIENPYTTMVGHLTGRLLLKREPYALNVDKVIDAAIANHTIIEINANPHRLDMDWRHWHKAKEKGLMTSINPDAHHTEHLQFVKYGVYVARKGWLEKKDVLNTYSLKKVKEYLNK